jgi:hypothetical protein
MMGTAWAGDANKLFITQSGADNTADIHQSGTSTVDGAGNDIGVSGAPVVQDGKRNYLGYSNAGYGAGSDNDIVKLRQDGNDNYFYASDNNGGAHNNINNVLQDGNVNQMTVLRGGEQSSTIDRVKMDGNHNSVYVKQGPIYRTGTGYGPYGDHNTISLIKIVGHDNGDTSLTVPSNPYNAGIFIQQTGSATAGGSHNTVDEASIEGHDNTGTWGTSPASFPYHQRHAISIYQEGSNNGRGVSIARIKGSHNELQVSEVGDWNNFDIRQGDGPGSDGNFASVNQLGSNNDATATQYGSGNFVMVNQNGDGNSSTTLFDGNDNGMGTLGGAAGALDLTSTNLTQGIALQDSSLSLHGNSLDYNVHGSRNLFAFAQIGGGNSIDGRVGTGGNSNDNQVAVLQAGNSNVTSFTQTGSGGNNLAVSQ